jgi:hypothetical protein
MSAHALLSAANLGDPLRFIRGPERGILADRMPGGE